MVSFALWSSAKNAAENSEQSRLPTTTHRRFCTAPAAGKLLKSGNLPSETANAPQKTLRRPLHRPSLARVVRIAAMWAAFALFIAGIVGWSASRCKAQPIYPVDRFGYLWAQLSPDAWVEEAHQKLASDSWIDKRYTHDGRYLCCYANRDCHVIPSDEVFLHSEGVQLSARFGAHVVKREMIQVSEDGRYWACILSSGVRCFFAPACSEHGPCN